MTWMIAALSDSMWDSVRNAFFTIFVSLQVVSPPISSALPLSSHSLFKLWVFSVVFISYWIYIEYMAPQRVSPSSDALQSLEIFV